MCDGAEHESASRRLISELLRTRTSLERFASLFRYYYEDTAQALHYVNPGHLPPMLVRRGEGGEVEIQSRKRMGRCWACSRMPITGKITPQSVPETFYFCILMKL